MVKLNKPVVVGWVEFTKPNTNIRYLLFVICYLLFVHWLLVTGHWSLIRPKPPKPDLKVVVVGWVEFTKPNINQQ